MESKVLCFKFPKRQALEIEWFTMTSPSAFFSTERQARNRRQFLRFLAASPVFSALPAMAWQQAEKAPEVLASAKDALNVMDFEAAAHLKVPPAHWGYAASGVDDDATLRANREAFKHIQIRPRRLVDVSKVDLGTELFGAKWETPIFICPVGGQKSFHPEGEVAVARAAKAKHTQQILSTATSTAVEEVAQALGSPLWYQLYAPARWEDNEKLVRRVEAAGCSTLVFTVDLIAGRNLETDQRFRRLDTRVCSNCHDAQMVGPSRRPMNQGLNNAPLPPGTPSLLTWDFVDRLKKFTRMKLLIKGIETREDAALCVEHGADGIIVSNHGGRATETLRATVDCLPEVVEAARGRVPVLVDGGFRRGTDIFKALALGATAVGIGRPYLWGLGAFGQPGVERVLDILRAELTLTMKQCGTRSLAEIKPSSIIHS